MSFRRPSDLPEALVVRLRGSLKTKLAFGATLLIGAISLVILLYIPAKQEDDFGRALADKAKSIAEMTASLVSSTLVFFDPEAAGEYLDGAVGIEGVLYAVVHDDAGEVFASRGGVPEEGAVHPGLQPGKAVLGGSVYPVSARILGEDGSVVGTVYLGLSLETLRKQVADSRRDIAFLAAVLFLLGMIGVYWVSSLVTGPLEGIVEAAKAIAGGDRSRRAPEGSRDEVGLLARAFNQMVENLEGAHDSLEAMNRSLEERVAERTRELEGEMAQRRKVQESQVLLATAVDQAAEIHIITSTDGTLEYVNPSFERTTGYRKKEVLGRPFRDLLSMENPPDLVEEVERAFREGSGWTGQIIKRKGVGDTYTERTAISPVRDPEGVVTRIVSVGHDITREVALEEQLRQSQKMEAVGRLAGGIAHDFNNLLTTIIGYSDMLLSDAEDSENTPELNEIQKAADRAASLTRQLLAFSRRQVLRPEPLSPGETVKDMMEMLQRLIGEDIRLTVTIDPADPLIKADKTQLEQVILNLVLNSRDAMPRGGEMSIDVKGLRSSSNGGGDRGRVQISVLDTGEGMDEEILSQVFEPFFTTKEVGKGTGLGLSTVYGIVQQSGGEVKAWSKPSVGTRFDVVFDEVSGQVPVPEKREVAPAGLRRQTVLVVEDEPMVRGLVQRQLEATGLSVLVAEDAEAALSVSDEFDGEIHGIVSDVIMPGVNGVELAEMMAQRRRGIGVLLMSGYTDRIPVKKGVAAAGFRLLNKPFSKDELLSALQEVLEGSVPSGR